GLSDRPCRVGNRGSSGWPRRSDLVVADLTAVLPAWLLALKALVIPRAGTQRTPYGRTPPAGPRAALLPRCGKHRRATSPRHLRTRRSRREPPLRHAISERV